jgi:hypothetical protein
MFIVLSKELVINTDDRNIIYIELPVYKDWLLTEF